MERRNFLRLTGVGAAASALGGPFATQSIAALATELAEMPGRSPKDLASDEKFWFAVRAKYAPPTDHLDLDHANTSPTAVPVFDAWVKRTRELSHAPAERFDKVWGDVETKLRPAVAEFMEATGRNIAFMGNSTVALNTVLRGFPMERGDEILVTDHEYPDMIESVLQREKREGIVVRKVSVPLPGEQRELLVDRVRSAITPRTKLLLISHVSAWSGEILPIEEVTAVAKSKGVAVLVDAAQSVGMLDVSFKKIGCDFLVTSFHKWLGSPLAAGVLVISEKQIGRVWPLHPPAWDTTEYPTDLYEWAGTYNIAATAAIGDALEFQKAIGLERKRERARFLGEYWQSRLRGVDRVKILTPQDVDRSFGVAAIMIDGIGSRDLAKYLRTRYRILVQDKAGRHSPFKNALRVSPGLYTTPNELDSFVAAVKEVLRTGIPPAKK